MHIRRWRRSCRGSLRHNIIIRGYAWSVNSVSGLFWPKSCRRCELDHTLATRRIRMVRLRKIAREGWDHDIRTRKLSHTGRPGWRRLLPGWRSCSGRPLCASWNGSSRLWRESSRGPPIQHARTRLRQARKIRPCRGRPLPRPRESDEQPGYSIDRRRQSHAGRNNARAGIQAAGTRAAVCRRRDRRGSASLAHRPSLLATADRP